jgi:4-amino-4-deoxy-L-arabinose transferase-like glycosyltransferase
MNGAFLYDLIRTGHLLHPITYAKAYYSQLPALSMPFHPPLFPSIEAIFFALFGVSLLTARVTVAVAVAISAILFYRLALATVKRPIIAACITLTTFSFWTLQFVARDVMLEFPVLVFSLAALYCLRDFPYRFSWREAILFACFSAAAVWTKQHAVFLGAVPFIQIALARRWRRLGDLRLWVSSALFGVTVLALVRFTGMFHGNTIEQMSTSRRDVYYIVTQTLPSYFSWVTEDWLRLPGLLLITSIGVYVASRNRRDAESPHLGLYIAWIIAALVVLIDLGHVAKRYLFLIMPAAAVIEYSWLFYGCRRLWGERRATLVTAIFALAFFAMGFAIPFDFLRGPGAAAHVVVKGTPTRVLYAGDGEGNFIFEARVLDPKLQVTVIPAIKLPRQLFESTSVAEICKRYGIEWVVLENIPQPRPWSIFKSQLPAMAQLERSIPLQSSRQRWSQGSVDVYHFEGALQHPDSVLELPVPKIHENIPAKL